MSSSYKMTSGVWGYAILGGEEHRRLSVIAIQKGTIQKGGECRGVCYLGGVADPQPHLVGEFAAVRLLRGTVLVSCILMRVPPGLGSRYVVSRDAARLRPLM